MAKTPLEDPDPEMEDIAEMRRLEGRRPAGKETVPRAALIGAIILVAVIAVIWFLYR